MLNKIEDSTRIIEVELVNGDREELCFKSTYDEETLERIREVVDYSTYREDEQD